MATTCLAASYCGGVWSWDELALLERFLLSRDFVSVVAVLELRIALTITMQSARRPWMTLDEIIPGQVLGKYVYMFLCTYVNMFICINVCSYIYMYVYK